MVVKRYSIRPAGLKGSVLAVALVAGLFAAPPTAVAQDSSASDADKFWHTRCVGPDRNSNSLVCTATQSILVSNTGKLLFRITVTVPANRQGTIMELQGPLNVYLPDGYSLSVDDSDLVKSGISNCNQAGCFSTLRLNADQVAQLKKGASLKISFSAQPQNTQFVETPLAGFTRAMQAIE